MAIAKEGFEREVIELGPWDLTELLPEPSEEEVASRVSRLLGLVEAFELRRAQLSEELSPSGLLEIVREYVHLVEEAHVLGSYGSLWFSSDTQSVEALTYQNRMEHLLTRMHNRTLFFTLWWKSLDDATATSLLPACEAAADDRHFLLDLRRLKPFVLEERSEQIINLKNANGVSAILTFYSMLTSRLQFQIDTEGERRKVTRDELMVQAHSPNPEARESAYRELARVYENEAPILGQLYVNRVRDWHAENVDLRGYSSPLSVRNLANDIPDKAVDALLQVTRDHSSLFHRYFRLKAEWLGMKRLRRYDLYAPLTASDKRFPFGDAVRLVLETLEQFEPRMAACARRVFDDRHVDSEVRPGKRGGAFCATVHPKMSPWVLLNYTGGIRDVATLAHEIGHAVHSLLAEDHNVVTQQAVLPLAETASVFSEILLTDRLLSEESNPHVQKEILAKALDDVYATVLRQAYFVLFEVEAHAAILAGKSPEDLCELYFQFLQEQFGASVEIAPEFRWEWITIPHIYHTPFYCYAYSFGQLLTLALYRRYKDQGKAFVPGYVRLLSRGGSAPPEEILAEVGVEMTDASFWRGGFEVVEEILDRLESLD